MADQPGFAQAGAHHEDLHRLMGEIVDRANRGDRDKAMQLMSTFNDVRTGLFGELDTLYCA
jgi:hypothetical protein